MNQVNCLSKELPLMIREGNREKRIMIISQWISILPKWRNKSLRSKKEKEKTEEQKQEKTKKEKEKLEQKREKDGVMLHTLQLLVLDYSLFNRCWILSSPFLALGTHELEFFNPSFSFICFHSFLDAGSAYSLYEFFLREFFSYAFFFSSSFHQFALLAWKAPFLNFPRICKLSVKMLKLFT